MWILVCLQFTKYGLIFMWHVVTEKVCSTALLSPTYWTCFCFVGYFNIQPFRRSLEKKSLKTSRNFQRNIWSSAFSFFVPKQQPLLQSNLKKKSFYSDKMRWERGWPKQLYVLFIVKTWNFTKRDFRKDLTYSSKVKYIKMYPDIMTKTSRSRHWVNIDDVLPNLKIFCLLRLILETITPNNFSKSGKFSTDISSPLDVFLGKGVLKICNKFTGEHTCRHATLLESHFDMGVLL